MLITRKIPATMLARRLLEALVVVPCALAVAFALNLLWAVPLAALLAALLGAAAAGLRRGEPRGRLCHHRLERHRLAVAKLCASAAPAPPGRAQRGQLCRQRPACEVPKEGLRSLSRRAMSACSSTSGAAETVGRGGAPQWGAGNARNPQRGDGGRPLRPSLH